MAPRCNQNFLVPRLSFQLLVLAMTWQSAFTESADTIQLRGEVGGKVSFNCPVDKQKPLHLLYFQKDGIFVNGYYASKNASSQGWENTILDLNRTTMIMYNLNLSHSGDYQCIIRYSDYATRGVPDIHLHLDVTANYSKPTHTVHCSDSNHHFGCLVTCSSHGGYPETEVMWHTPLKTLRVVNNSGVSDPDTKTFNISSAAYLNCSDGKLTSVNCSVGDVSSGMFSVCTPKDPPDSNNPHVIPVAICAVLFFVIVMALMFYYKKGPRRAAAVPELQENGNVEELRGLR
ncbi:uncharacterized protein LOC129091988 [Anoplopoma fimbria]|uniref:uncharacterized protein LOC129091988 n=1 Tax=Anoplopoma fimbria TaxID=229290 RepID=UPI0023EC70AE|nr:uncharacterized protein LOC129091988 [Anoplopoma fimbria]